jgi:uncharacterized membrane protein
MKARLAKISEKIRSSLWLLPAVLTVVISGIAFVLIEFDRRTNTAEAQLPWTFQGGAESARSVLSTIAGSMITVAGTTYSIVIVALVLASTQFAPRVLRGFMRDRKNQIILGFFIATFTYCLLVLRAVRGLQDDQFVPGTAITGGVVLALISLGMLIYFIDYISHNIQVSSIISTIAQETVHLIRQLYSQDWSAADGAYAARHSVNTTWTPVLADTSGYLEFVDYDELLERMVHEDRILRVDRVVGDFVIAGTPLAYVAPAGPVSATLQAQINDTFALGRNRTMQQDIAFGIRQIVDIALKALSPGINDPTTAVNCIDYLGVILITLAGRAFPALDRTDAQGQIRILAREMGFQDFADLAFDQIRHFGAKDPAISRRLLETIAQMAVVTRSPAHCAVLADHVERVALAVEREMEPHKIPALAEYVRAARQAAGAAGSPDLAAVGATRAREHAEA